MRKVEVTKYNEEWISLFKEEVHKLSKVFGDELIDVHHIGSTSIKGMKAKPIIDILPVVKDIKRIDGYDNAMVSIGYEPKGENGIPKRRYFQKGGDQRTHHVHIYEQGNSEIERHLAFRDYLRTHPEDVIKYGNIKEKLSKQFPYDIESYIEGKEKIVIKIERKALAWYRS
ncbi:GrpB family protein [Bacillus sp. RG28]|uniref:GrpB family protein n=1 Tax=Gottfriedia endophytica TaxID=2820819 RepID=A0A940NJQ6_9BACI|nr:GrpB family protein [Gottfriedia endophytica]MBP0725695.1 GrpB family protein [Gottfriedia endophytica]